MGFPPAPGGAYTMLRSGTAARRIPVTDEVAFDVDEAGRILGILTTNGADWVASLLDLVIAGKVQLDGDLPSVPPGSP